MKIIIRIIIALLLIVIVAVIALYLLLNTHWGTKQISDYLNKDSKIQLSFSDIDYRWSSWDVVRLNHLKIKERNAAPWLTAQTAEVTLSIRQLFEPDYSRSITLRDGSLNFSTISDVPNIRADTLNLFNMQILDNAGEIAAKGVTATVTPWMPLAGKLPGSRASFQARAIELNLNGIAAQNVLTEGNWSEEGLNLTSVNAQVAGGSMSGSLQRTADGQWHINDVDLTAPRMQTEKSLSEWLNPLMKNNQSIIINSLNVDNARLEGKEWAVTDLDFTLSNLTLGRGGWQSENGSLAARASEAIIGSIHLQQPELAATFSPDGITFSKIVSGWEKGTVSANGQWIRRTQRLNISRLALDNLEYTLPDNWKTYFTRPLPNWLAQMTVEQLTASRNLLIDIDSLFPWQITALNGNARGLQLIQERRLGVWSGQGEFKASAATFNRTDIASPSIAFSADNKAIMVNKFVGIVDKGQLEATASIAQDSKRQTQIRLQGNGIDANALNNWGWPKVDLTGAVNLTLQAEASLTANQALRQSVNATLEANGNNGQAIHQIMRHGELAH